MACLLAIAAPAPVVADAPRIIVEIEGLRSSRGEVRGALFASRQDWVSQGREVATCRAQIEARRATCVIDGVRAGAYAFAFLHDEDDDGELDRNWIGIPEEGFGFSNDAPTGLGPPGYERARFAHAGRETTIVVHVRYGI